MSNEITAPRATQADVLSMLALGKISVEQAAEMLAALAPKVGLTCKVSERTGAVCLHGLQRMPVTLYAEQWERLLGEADMIRAFLKANVAKLATGKDDSATRKAAYDAAHPEYAKGAAAKPVDPATYTAAELAILKASKAA